MNNPKFSLIVPTYNRASLIKETLKSILAQDYNNFEVIVVDDGSKDNTKEVVEAFNDLRVKYYWKENGERGAARNYGAALAKGEIINFFDSDDICYVNHLNVADNYYCNERTQNTVLHTSYEFLVEQKKANRTIQEGCLNSYIFKRNILSCNNVFVPKKIFEQNKFSEDRNLTSAEDWALWCRLAAQYDIIGCPDVTSAIVQHSSRSMVLATGLNIETSAVALEKEFKKYSDILKAHSNVLKNGKPEMYSLSALHYAVEGKRKDALRCLIVSILSSLNIVFTRRFLAIIKHIILN